MACSFQSAGDRNTTRWLRFNINDVLGQGHDDRGTFFFLNHTHTHHPFTNLYYNTRSPYSIRTITIRQVFVVIITHVHIV